MQALATAELDKEIRRRSELIDRLQVTRKALSLDRYFPIQPEHVVAQLILARKLIPVDFQEPRQKLSVHLAHGLPMRRTNRVGKPVVVSVVADRCRAHRIEFETALEEIIEKCGECCGRIRSFGLSFSGCLFAAAGRKQKRRGATQWILNIEFCE